MDKSWLKLIKLILLLIGLIMINANMEGNNIYISDKRDYNRRAIDMIRSGFV